jgi:phosphoribosyl-ATP pyrophosphohydrolase/phosphoribosyl-AMP cyclohydrolase
MEDTMNFDKIKFDDRGLVPVVVQDVNTNAVVMLAYMNKESIEKTLEIGEMVYFSRSRQELWHKGATSGNIQTVHELKVDCDGDTLLALVSQKGVACHTGNYSCFFETLSGGGEYAGGYRIIDELFAVIEDRKVNPKEGSYTNYLFEKGIDKILKKVGEEAAEVIIAAKNASVDEIRYETADLFYHLMVMLAERGVNPSEVFAELEKRR